MADSTTYWENLSKKIQNPSETKNKRPDTSDLEVSFIANYLKPEDEVLDIGSGSGLITNKLIDKVSHITTVEKFTGFTKFIVEHPNMLVINADILGFKMRKQFDAVLCLGVAQYFKKQDALDMYYSLFEMTKPGGVLIVRMHCGLEKDKIVNGYSEELQTNYFAEYRYVNTEVEALKSVGFDTVEKHDILPDTLNVWPDTRHFIFVCKKRN
jgi:cyclopropane fatty-acyl-phospholipid synthase-like methyltransferase